ncbi:hypothetical protein L6164_028364 [Bauhinia variegata]|uniref:Uncharacterized protein n=1 Tax=Bauhinia variegata TaxID=167791 RepID=A0ACB9LW47_BAUVA|nr:hypothetical protein L6164_028364 [Bauhinia variegata]
MMFRCILLAKLRRFKIQTSGRKWVGITLNGSCCNCRNHVAPHDDAISKAFQCLVGSMSEPMRNRTW